jgi:hypothetical protein
MRVPLIVSSSLGRRERENNGKIGLTVYFSTEKTWGKKTRDNHLPSSFATVFHSSHSMVNIRHNWKLPGWSLIDLTGLSLSYKDNRSLDFFFQPHTFKRSLVCPDFKIQTCEKWWIMHFFTCSNFKIWTNHEYEKINGHRSQLFYKKVYLDRTMSRIRMDYIVLVFISAKYI